MLIINSISLFFSFLDVVWYKNDKLVSNTQNVKVRISDEEKKTSLTIKHATEEDDATYVCKATSEIGLATTKAKLRVTGTISFLIYQTIYMLFTFKH